MKKSFNKRKAVNCKMIGRSKSNPGYFKYEVTVAGVDNKKTIHPVYGKDMQDALSRVIKKELTVKVERKLETNVGLIFLTWLAVMGAPAFFADTSSPWFLLYTFGSVMLLAIIATWWYSHVNKGDENV